MISDRCLPRYRTFPGSMAHRSGMCHAAPVATMCILVALPVAAPQWLWTHWQEHLRRVEPHTGVASCPRHSRHPLLAVAQPAATPRKPPPCMVLCSHNALAHAELGPLSSPPQFRQPRGTRCDAARTASYAHLDKVRPLGGTCSHADGTQNLRPTKTLWLTL